MAGAALMASLAGSILNYGMNRGLQDEQNRTNIELNERNNRLQQSLAAQANQWSIDQWNRENAYNVPANQVARLRAAGLNPALIYGNGIMNEAASSPSVQMPSTRPAQVGRAEFNIDPLTASQIEVNKAQAKSIEDANTRENQKQPYTIEQMEEDIKQTHQKTNEILQNINNLKFDEQLKSVQYLKDSLDYQFSSTTFNDAVEQFKTTLDNLKLVGKQQEFDYHRAMQYLSYEVVGWDLSNQRQRALLNIDRQTYRQTEALFEDVKRKAFWDSQNSYMDWRLKGQEEGILKADKSLKELAFWIDARENKVAYGLYRDNKLGFNVDDNFFGKWFVQLSDYWNHGFNLPIHFSFGK